MTLTESMTYWILHLGWIPASASMTGVNYFDWMPAEGRYDESRAGMTDLGIRNFVHVSLDTGMRQYDEFGREYDRYGDNEE